jgi:hypothetical protein
LATINDSAVVRAAIETAITSAGQSHGSIARQQEIRMLGELLVQLSDGTRTVI